MVVRRVVVSVCVRDERTGAGLRPCSLLRERKPPPFTSAKSAASPKYKTTVSREANSSLLPGKRRAASAQAACAKTAVVSLGEKAPKREAVVHGHP